MFRETYAAVRGYARRRAVEDVAQDVVAETFLVAWRRFDELPDDALPWLYGVARRVLANRRRADARGEALAERLTAGAAVADEGFEARVDDAQAVRIALARLSDADREALTLVAWHGLSRARAARAMGCTRATFAVRLHRARSRLAAELRELESQGAPVHPRSMEVT